MIKRFICPDGTEIACEACLAKCPHGKRCCPPAYLQGVSNNRPWLGEPSVTQLLQPPLKQYLQLTCDYAVRPDSRLPLFEGTSLHAALESSKTPTGIYEQRFSLWGITGCFDAFEPDEATLYDYKKYACRTAYWSTKNKVSDVVIQMNFYATCIEEHLQKEVKHLILAVFLKDYGDPSTMEFGFTSPIQMLNIQKLDREFLKGYLEPRRDALVLALQNKRCPRQCDKCFPNCEVRSVCPYKSKEVQRG